MIIKPPADGTRPAIIFLDTLSHAYTIGGYLMSSTSPCPACGSSGMSNFFDVKGLPVHSMLLLDDRNEAIECPKGDIALAFCGSCGFISNLAFDPALMNCSVDYESSQAYSPRFIEYAKELAIKLIDRHGLRGKDIVEIGCGAGDFLALICALGGNRGVGIDPIAGCWPRGTAGSTN